MFLFPLTFGAAIGKCLVHVHNLLMSLQSSNITLVLIMEALGPNIYRYRCG
jgi:hypothetical protein